MPLPSFLLETTQAIIRIPDSQELLQAVCSKAVLVEGIGRARMTQNRDGVLSVVADAGEGEAPALFWEQHVVDGGRSFAGDLGKSGPHSRWASCVIVPLRLAGEVWGCVGFYSSGAGRFTPQDASALQDLARDLETGLNVRAHEKKRKENEQFLSDMANLIPGTFYKVTLERDTFDFGYVSPGVDLLLPFSPGQVRSDAGLVFRALHPADRRRFFRAGARSRDFLTVFSLEFRLLRPNGAVVWVLATAFPQKQGETVVWTGLAIDVTPQNKLQEALQREQELLAVILDNIGDGVVAIDEKERLALVNQTAARLLESAEAVSGPWQDLDPDLPWNASDRFHPWFRRRPDGSLLHLEAHASDLTDEGRPRGRVLLLRDMTDRDRIEERLRQSEKLESIGLLAGGIAHDFNNLLTGVFGFIQLASMNADHPEKVVSYLEHALGPFQRARTLTQQLLTFAKGGEIAKVVISLERKIPEMLELCLEGTKVTWECSAQGAWTVLANEAQVHQVFENLFVNARQALPEGGHLRCAVRNVPAPGPEGRELVPGPFVEITVEDNGPGVPPEALPKIFDPFFTTKPGGTGLGLSICFSVVKKHGGAIEAENLPVRGTLFRIFLPAQVTPAAKAE